MTGGKLHHQFGEALRGTFNGLVLGINRKITSHLKVIKSEPRILIFVLLHF